MWKLYQFWLGIGLFFISLFLGWGLPMIISSTPQNGIRITLIGVFVSILFFIWAYILYRRQQRHPKKLDTPNSEAYRPFSGIMNGMLGVQSHKCSQCGWGFKVNVFDKVATCPKCGNVDNVETTIS